MARQLLIYAWTIAGLVVVNALAWGGALIRWLWRRRAS
jgi:hypothetical protein